MRGGADRTLFTRRNDEVFLVAQIYVDDIVFDSTSNECALDFSKEMKSEFEMSMVGELTYFLGFQVKQLKNGIFLSQSKYAKELVKKFGLESTKHFRTPMPTNLKLSKDEFEKVVEETLYRSMTGSLLYLTTSKPDITFSIGVCARYQACLKESHLIALKRIIRYIAGTLELSLWYPFDTHSDVTCYIDADWAGNVDDRKNTLGGCFYIGNCLVAWMSKKQNSVSLSTAEAEYIATVSKKEVIPYGILITKICQRAGVEFPVNSSFLEPMGPIDTSSWNRSQGKIKGALGSKKKVCHSRATSKFGESDSDSDVDSSVIAQFCARFDVLDEKISA
ncbi:hypothetical protein AAG906_035651 [Vitis piasezkii]